jgi:hypothetical protein
LAPPTGLVRPRGDRIEFAAFSPDGFVLPICRSADLPFCGLPCPIMAEHHAGTRIRPARDTDILRACGGAALSRRFVEIISLSPNGFVLPTGGGLPKIAAGKAPRTGFH